MLCRILLAIESKELRRQVRELVGGSGAVVEVARPGSRLWHGIARSGADVLVVSHALVPPDSVDVLQTLGELPDAPAVVVIGANVDAVARAALLTAGCEAVIDAGLPSESLRQVLRTLIDRRMAVVGRAFRSRRALGQPRLADFVSDSPVMQSFMDMVQRVVDARSPLLLQGETGVGKERLARAIHAESPRSGGPFVPINCGALPESLLESELFGHEQGSFTGATRSRRGCFELAHQGTLFLDEIGELPYHLQVKLLRVLQDGEVQRVGSERRVRVDVRVMAATNRDLVAEIEERRFRQDLYFRLSVVTLTVPPLRERREDIPELVESYIEHLRPRIGRDVFGILPDALDALCHYHWPGNVRELINVLERAMLLCRSDRVSIEDLPGTVAAQVVRSGALLPSELAGSGPESVPDEWLGLAWRDVRTRVLERAERAYLAALLRDTHGRVGETAKRAGMRPRSLFDKMKRYGLRKEDFR